MKKKNSSKSFIAVPFVIVVVFVGYFLLELRSAQVLRLAQFHSDQQTKLTSNEETELALAPPAVILSPFPSLIPSPTPQAKNLQNLPPLWPEVSWGKKNTGPESELGPSADSDYQSFFQFKHRNYEVWAAKEKNTDSNMLRFYSQTSAAAGKTINTTSQSMYTYYKKTLTELGWQVDTYYQADGPNRSKAGFIAYQGNKLREIVIEGSTTEDSTQKQCGSGGCSGPSTHNYKLYVSDISEVR